MDFGAFFNFDGDGDVLPEVKVPPAVPPVAGTAPVVPAAGAEPAQPGAPTAVPATQVPPEVAQPSAQSPLPQDASSLARALVEHEAAAIDHLASTMFRLSDADQEALETDAVGTIPKLMARAVVKAQQNMFNAMAQLVPQMMQQQITALKKNSESEGAFYNKWPQVKKAEHGATVTRLAVAYRQAHPQATREQMIADLGPMVMMTAGISMQPVVPGAPVAPLAANGSRPPQPSPFSPAAGQSVTGASNDSQESEWDFLNPSKGD